MNERGIVTMRNEDGSHYYTRQGFAQCRRSQALLVTRFEFEALERKAPETRMRDCPDNGFFGWYQLTFHPQGE